MSVVCIMKIDGILVLYGLWNGFGEVCILFEGFLDTVSDFFLGTGAW